MATFEEFAHSIKMLVTELEREWGEHKYDDALGTVEDIRFDLERLEKIVEQRFAGETS
jgi:hypothetical protein